MTNNKSTLDNCGCCEGVEFLTPAATANEHGLASLLYRVGTHGMFKASMLRGLSDSAILKELTIREDDDATIALFDVWAVILDVLTFYNERIINEGYVLTARERLSLVEVARHINYIPKPGVAANSWFSFQMEEAIGAPKQAKVPVGTRVQSIPEQDEKAQIFESIEEIIARTRWNNIQPKLFQNQTLTTGSTSLYLEGVNTQLQKGDYLLIVGNPSTTNWSVRKIESIILNNKDNITQVTWLDQINIINLLEQKNDNNNTAKVYALRQRASFFGYNAPDFRTMSDEVKESFNGTGWTSDEDWADFDIPNNVSSINLDTVYSKIIKNSWIVLIDGGNQKLFQLSNSSVVGEAKFAMTARCSQLTLVPNTTNEFSRRGTLVLGQSEELILAKAPILSDVSGKSIDISRGYPSLKIGQKLIITGQLISTEVISPDQDVIVNELLEIENITSDRIVFKNQLEHTYLRKTVTINANVAQATHGETKSEILGSGNGAISFQRFFLKQKPLTYISSASSSGIATTLEVRVNDIRWTEVPTFYNRTSEERIYVTRTEDDGKVYVQFGNGITGARLPSGSENIRAIYRVGIGLEGILKSEQLSLLLNPQLGIKSVRNPLPTTGAESPESINDIRQNAPLTILTLDRIVSIEDFENFTAAFAGIGKARADLMWKGEDRTIHLTVASADEGPIDSTLQENLLSAINNARHDNYPVLINSFNLISFNVKARIKIDPDYLNDSVIKDVKSILIQSYKFDNRVFGQSVSPSEVIAIIHAVNGVIAVDLDELGGVDPFSVSNYLLTANIARWNGTTINPAELLLIDENDIEIIPIN